MPILRTPRVRTALVDPNVPPPGTVAVTYGAGLVVSDGAVVAVDFGTTSNKVAAGTKLPGSKAIDTGDPAHGDVLAYNAGTGKFAPSTPWASPTTTRGDLIRRGATGDERLALDTRGYVLRAGATDPAWSAAAASTEELPAAGADCAAAVYWDATVGGLYVCAFAGATPAWGWRVLDAHPGVVDGAQTPDDAWTTLATVTLPADTATLLDVDVVGAKSDHSAAVIARGAAGYVCNGTTASVAEALTLLIGDSARVRLVESGLDVSVQVKGVVAETWTWRAKLSRRLEVEPV